MQTPERFQFRRRWAARAIFVLVALAVGSPVHAVASAKPSKKSATKAAKPQKQKTPSAEAILRHFDDGRVPEGTIVFKVQIEDWEKGSKLREQIYRVSSKGDDRALVETLAPERMQGRKLLMRGDNLWLFLPNLKRPSRVGLEQRLTGEVANGDVARTRFSADYTPKLVGTKPVDGKSNYVLDLRAKRKATTYRRVVLYVDVKDLLPTRAEFFAISGKRLKASRYSDFKEVLGAKRASHVEIEDALRPEKKSILNYSDYTREEIDDSVFTKESLW